MLEENFNYNEHKQSNQPASAAIVGVMHEMDSH